MKKLSGILLLGAVMTGGAWAADLPVDGDFKELKADKSPAKWILHPWGGFKPAPKIELVKAGDDNVLKVSNITAKYGVGIRSTVTNPGVAGDKVKISFDARGTGKFYVTLYQYTDKNGWNATSPEFIVNLTPEWKEYKSVLTIRDGAAGKTGKFSITVGAYKDGSFEVKDIDAGMAK